MKPQKTLLFLLLALCLTTVFCFLTGNMGYDTLQRHPWQRQGRPRHSALFKHSDSNKTKDHQDRMLQWQTRWHQDSLLQLYKRIYRIRPHIFQQAALQDLPLVPLETDSAGTGKILLQHFFARLLALSNPAEANTVDLLYRNSDFWTENLSGNRLLFSRILYYNDGRSQHAPNCQILRNLFQADFGGSGPGFLPFLPQPQPPGNTAAHYLLEKSGDWHQVAATDAHRRGNYGISSAYLSPQPISTIAPHQDAGLIDLYLPEQGSSSPVFLELIAHEDVQAADIQLYAQSKELPLKSSLSTFGQKRLSYAVPSSAHHIRLRMDLKRNRNLYAILLNDTVGISVDQLCLPQSQGNVFSVNNRRFLMNQLNLANADLILYQFDAEKLTRTAIRNIPHNNQDAHPTQSGMPDPYQTIKTNLLRELAYFRSLMPAVPLVVIGCLPSANALSNPDLDPEQLRRIQREAAFQTACLYWDADLALEQTTVTNQNQAELTARLFYKALLDAYRQFLQEERRNMSIRRVKSLVYSDKSETFPEKPIRKNR